MENKLISLSEYIELQEKLIPYENSGTVAECDRIFVRRVISYQRFLKQPLTLGMFTPCDGDGNVLEPVIKMDYESKYPSECYEYDLGKYEEAKERVLFKGFEIGSLNTVVNSELSLTIYLDTYQFTIEDSLGVGGGDIWGNTLEALANVDLQIELTECALKQIGLKTN